MNIDQVRELLRKACDEAGGQRAFALSAGVHESYVSNILSGKRGPNPPTLRALRLREVTSYELDIKNKSV